MKKILTLVCITLIVLNSCKPTSEISTSHVSNNLKKSDKGLIYALPKTNLVFSVEATVSNVIPGPYSAYAEKYLGIENVPKKESSTWHISNIDISSFQDIDQDHFYLIEPKGKVKISFNKLIENGSIIPIDKCSDTFFNSVFYGKNEPGNEIVFKDLSLTKYIGKEQITYFKKVQRDSIFAKIPVTKTQSVYKSFEDKAEEAASFIFLIREKRFELLSGMADFYPEGKSLSIAIDELNKLENEYLELFTGKIFSSTYIVSFDYVPTAIGLDQPYILFRFDEEKGVLSPNDLRGRPIIVELEKLGQTKNLSYLMDDQVNREGNTYKNRFYYRIPDVAKVKLYDGKTLLATRKLNIQQFGIVVQIPTIFLMDGETFIDIDKK